MEITDLARAGSGIARDPSGRVLFVALTVPGDVVQVRVIKAEKRYAEAEVVEMIKPSTLRIKSKCEVFGQCGGCLWQMVPYYLQWKTKWEGGLHALKKRGVEAQIPIDLFPAESTYGYRNRIQLRTEAGKVGFFARRSHDLVPIQRCEVAQESLNGALPTVSEKASAAHRQKVELEILPDGQVRQTWNAPHAAAGFRQVNEAQNQQLRKWIARNLRSRGPLLDLFGGDANLSTLIAHQMASVEVVDLGVPSQKDSKLPEHLRFHRSPVRPWLGRARIPAEAAILDPPRIGLADDFNSIESDLRRLGVREVIAVGCDVDSWARDIAYFLKKNWRLERIAFLDFFPQTPHFESAAHLFV